MNNRITILFGIIVLMLKCEGIIAQCVTSFPYTEGFEINDGNWITGGTNSDWTWGTPTKSRINAAAKGINCWITGGLSNPIYNGGEKSFLISPCFDFSLLTSPYIKFQIFWDTEKYYDGGNFQYSIDGGISWLNVGVYTSSTSCSSNNWFNEQVVFNLSGIASPSEGWSGNTNIGGGSCRTGGGLGKWVFASNCLKYLAGQPKVRFRFTFCSGTSCNTYDGIAIDDIFIGEAPAETADFTVVCTDGNTINVTANASSCVNSYEWDFGEPGSQGNNGTKQSEVHTYSTTGPFSISLKTKFDCSPDFFIQKNITVIDANITTYPVTCKDGNDGAATVLVNGSANSILTWNTNPIQNTDSIGGLKTGKYQLIVADPNGCSVTKHFDILYGPNAFVRVDLGADKRLCPGDEYILNPGVFQTYLWNDGSILSFKNVVDAGIYSVIVTNVDGCIGDDSIIIKPGCGDVVWMPNAFTPNGDSKNDFVFAYGVAIEKFEISIFNRWGQEVFNANDISIGWDGSYLNKPAPEGIYGYVLTYTLYDRKKYEKKGTVLLSR